MDQHLWHLAQAQEEARLSVEQLVESAERSRVHKQHCHAIANVAQELFRRLELGVRERSGDGLTLCAAAARLRAVVNNSRSCVESVGNPSRLERLTSTIFTNPRKNAERVLQEQCASLVEVSEQYRTVLPNGGSMGGMPALSVITHNRSGILRGMSSGPLSPCPTGNGRTAREKWAQLSTRLGIHSASSPLAAPWPTLGSVLPDADATPRIQRDPSRGLTTSPGGGTGLLPQLSGLRGTAVGPVGPGSECMPISPSAGSEEADTLRSLPFRQRSVRPSDGNPIQRLCFMRGAGGESAAVQLMVVLSRQVEVYSAALDSFHSDTPLDVEAQQVTSTALYEPTIDLVTGHRGGSVLVYGRVGALLPPSASTLRGGGLSIAAAAATAAQQAGVPLVIRLSRAAVTALHCVPAIELEAATAAAQAAASNTAAATAAAKDAVPSSTEPPGTSEVTSGEERNSAGQRTPGAGAGAQTTPAAPSPEAVASGAVGSCTADDVLLFTGDATGRVMAIRYSRVQPEVLAAIVFITSRRSSRRTTDNNNNNSNNANNNSNNGNNGSGASTSSPPPEQPISPEVTNLLYRSGCLLVSTATDMYSIRVLSAPQQQTGAANGGGRSGGENGGGNEGKSGPPGGTSGNAGGAGGAAGGPSTAAANGNGAARTTSLPQSSSVNLLSPAASAMPGRNGAGSTPTASPGGGGAAGGSPAGAGAASPASPSGTEPIIRRGALSLSAVLVDSSSFADFDSCTALVAIDWPVPGGGSQSQSASASGEASSSVAMAPTTPRRSGSLPAGSLLSMGPAMTENNSLAIWAIGSAREPQSAASAANGAAGAGPAGAAGRSPKLVAAKQGPWRMLSAHMNGQLLMWDVTAGRLQLICAIGQQGPSIVNVFTFPDLGAMVELLSTGHIRVGPLPTSALAPPINPLGNVPVWQFNRASLRAHRGRLTAGAALANCIATGSRAGGVKVWSAADLRAQAARQDVAFLSPWPGSGAAGASASGGGAAAAAGAAAGAALLANRTGASTSPTASAPYPNSDHPNYSHRVSRTGAPNSEDPGGFPGGLAGVRHHAPSVPSSISAPYPLSNGGPYSAFSRTTSSHHLMPPGSYPNFNAPSTLPGPPYGDPMVLPHSYAPSMLPPSTAGSVSGHMGYGPAVHQQPPLPPQQRVPGPSAGGAPSPDMAAPMPPPSGSGRRGAMTAAAVAALGAAGQTPFGPMSMDAAGSEGSSSRNAQLPPPPPNGLANGNGLGNGLGNGHGNGLGHGPFGNVGMRKDDDESVLLNTESLNGGAGPSRAPQPTRQRSTQQQQQSQSQSSQQAASAVAKVSERPNGGDSTPSRAVSKAPPPQSLTERAVRRVLDPNGTGDDATSNKLPTVGPVGLNPEEAAAVAAEDAAGGNIPSPGPGMSPEMGSRSGTEGGAIGLGQGLGRIPSTSRSNYVSPLYSPSAHGAQYFQAPPSPTPGPGTSMFPATVRQAAFDEFGAPTQAYMAGAGASTGGASYPNMPAVGTEAIPQPPAQHAPQAQMYSPQPPRQQMVPFSEDLKSFMPPPPQQQYGGGGGGYAGHPPQGHGNAMMYVSTSPGPAPPGVMMYGPGPGPGRTSDMGTVPPPPQSMFVAHGGEQHVPGSHFTGGRRMSYVSEYSGRMSPFETQDSGEVVGLPPPPVVRPPPEPTAQPMPTGQETQLTQNFFIRPEELRNVEQIGEGAEGVVYRGRWHHIDVAVKEMHEMSDSYGHLASLAKDLSGHDPTSPNNELAGLIKEVTALIDLGQHPNVIRFIGICPQPPRIVTEYYKMGSLYSMLKDARRGNIRTRERLAWDKRLIMLKDIAAGMAFLHSRDYIHGDLRSPNVFVTEDQHLKLGDFGFARILGKAQNHVVPARLTNPRWQAPEVYDMKDPIATTAADVYSFGIIMYEMLTFRLPYNEEPEDEVVKMRHALDPSWRPHVPPDSELPVQKSIHLEGHLPPLQAYKTLMMDCWAENPADRPHFHKIAGRLNALCHWQWALSLIQRGLHFRQKSRPRGGGVDASADVTPGGVTPTAVSSPTASLRGPPVPTQVLNRMLEQVASSLQDEGGIDRRYIEGLHHEETPFAAASSPATAPSSTAAAQPSLLNNWNSAGGGSAAGTGAAALPLVPQLPPLQGAAPPPAAQPAQVPPPPRQQQAEGASQLRSQPQPQAQAPIPVPAPPPFSAARPEGPGGSPVALAALGSEAARLVRAHAVEMEDMEGTDADSRRETDSGSNGPLAATNTNTNTNGITAAPAPALTTRPPPGPLPQPQQPPKKQLYALPDDDLETAPTLASTGSRPLQVPAAPSQAARRPPSPPPRGLGLPPRQAPPTSTAPPQLPAVGGEPNGDGHALLSPFQAMRFSDDEDEEPSGRATPNAGPQTAQAVAAGIAAAAAGLAAATEPAVRQPKPVVTAPAQAPRSEQAVGSAPRSADTYGVSAAGGAVGSRVDSASAVSASQLVMASEPPPLASVTSVAPPLVVTPPVLPEVAGYPVPAPPPAAPSGPAAAVQAPPAPVAAAAPPPAPGHTAALQRVSSFEPRPADDPLEMRTAFQMGTGFSIDDDD